MKLEAPETRALVRFLNEWDPHLVIDTHTTNGSHHRYTITYEGPKNPAGDRRLIAFSRDELFPEVGGRVREGDRATRSFFYGNFEGDHTRWTSFPATPRFGTTYVGLRNRLSVLSEAYSYAPFKDRVLATRDFCRACLEFAADHRDEIRALLDDARRPTVEAGRDPSRDRVAIRSKARALPGKATVLGFVERAEDGRIVATGRAEGLRLRPRDRLRPDPGGPPAVRLPDPARVRPAPSTSSGPTGSAVEALRRGRGSTSRSRRSPPSPGPVAPSRGTRRSTSSTSKTTRQARTVPAGTLVVRTAQPLGHPRRLPPGAPLRRRPGSPGTSSTTPSPRPRIRLPRHRSPARRDPTKPLPEDGGISPPSARIAKAEEENQRTE